MRRKFSLIAGSIVALALLLPLFRPAGAQQQYSFSTIVWADGIRQTFNPDGTTPGINVGAQAGDPSTPTNGDLWYDSTGNLLRARINSASVSLSAGITNSAGANIIPKSNGTNLVASGISDDGTTVSIAVSTGKKTIIGTNSDPNGFQAGVANANTTCMGDCGGQVNGSTVLVEDNLPRVTVNAPFQIGAGGGSVPILRHLSATASLNFANLAAIGCEDLTITVTGAALGDTVVIGVPNASVVANSDYTGWVSATNTVTVRFCTLVSGDPAAGTFRADVWQH